MFIFKQPEFGDEVPPHQDASFLYTEPNSVIGCWLALEDANVDNGCLWVLAKGHKGNLKNRFIKRDKKLYFGHEERVFWPRQFFKPIIAKAGDVVVLHGLLPHLSEQNRSRKTRFAYTLHFIDQKCHFEKTNWLHPDGN
jgi:phytanoyl-CoA hydroxylase